MDLIYMNKEREDVGVLLGYKFDLAFGSDENDFELQIPSSEHCCKAGFFLYIENTEYGGMIDDIGSDTDAEEVAYTGRTWHGLLNSKIIKPNAGEDYLVLSGEANAVIGGLITRLGLGDLFTASDEDSGLTVSSYKMNRYIPAYEGIRKMLKTVEGKLRFSFSGGRVVLSAHPRMDYTQDGDLDSDHVGLNVKRHYHLVNHLICLGRGELAAREVIHLYLDADGNIGKTQTFTGMDEREDIYENANVESLEELESRGIDRFKELSVADEVETSLDEDSDQYEIQDLIGATDNITGLTATAEITKKIVNIENGQITISYKVG